MAFNYAGQKVSIYNGVNDNPVSASPTQGGNGADLINRFNTVLTNLKSDFTTVEGNISIVSIGVSENESDITTLQSDLFNLSARVTSAESNISNISNLSARVASAESNISNLSSSVSTLQSNVKNYLTWQTKSNNFTIDLTSHKINYELNLSTSAILSLADNQSQNYECVLYLDTSGTPVTFKALGNSTIATAGSTFSVKNTAIAVSYNTNKNKYRIVGRLE